MKQIASGNRKISINFCDHSESELRHYKLAERLNVAVAGAANFVNNIITYRSQSFIRYGI